MEVKKNDFVHLEDLFIYNWFPTTQVSIVFQHSSASQCDYVWVSLAHMCRWLFKDNCFKCALSEFFKLLNPNPGGLFVLEQCQISTCFCLLCVSAPRWEEVRGFVQAAGLGCEDHPTLVQTTTQPRETQHTGTLLREHVRIGFLSVLAFFQGFWFVIVNFLSIIWI